MAHPDAADVREAATLAGRGVAAATTLVRDVHVAVARRAFRAVGPAARPAHLAHDAISKGVYAAVGAGLRLAAGAAGTVVATRVATTTVADPRRRRFVDHPGGNVAVGALNGAWGDRLAHRRSRLALGMTLRHDDADLPVDRDALAVAYPGATGDVAVFLHGLCETDVAWRRRAEEHYGDSRSTHGSRLFDAVGLTPVYLRYNTGRHISDNGEMFATLLTDLVRAWPVDVHRLTLVGHSMGGLVIRSACHVGVDRDEPWLPLVRRVVYLGAPHLGAPLELAATVAGVVLRRLPETRPLADALASRSVGIKDLRYGDVRADDWTALADLDAWRPEPAECAPLLETAEHYYVGATISARHDTLAARVVGDALVTFASASGSGRRRRLALELDRGRHLGGLHHFDLLNHPRVYEQLLAWLRD